MEIIDELRETGNLASLLLCVPTGAEPWLVYQPPKLTQDQTTSDKSELDDITFEIAGIPLHWKMYTFLTVVIPKFMIWILLASEGTQFLMETASIQDLIINSLSMGLVLQMDELIMSRLCSDMAKVMMERLEPYKLFDCSEEDGWTDEVSMKQHQQSPSRQWRRSFSMLLVAVPGQLLSCLVISVIAYLGYYRRFCTMTTDGSFISKPLYPPKDVPKNPFHLWLLEWLFFPLDVDRVEEPTWTMPEEKTSL